MISTNKEMTLFFSSAKPEICTQNKGEAKMFSYQQKLREFVISILAPRKY